MRGEWGLLRLALETGLFAFRPLAGENYDGRWKAAWRKQRGLEGNKGKPLSPSLALSGAGLCLRSCDAEVYFYVFHVCHCVKKKNYRG